MSAADETYQYKYVQSAFQFTGKSQGHLHTWQSDFAWAASASTAIPVTRLSLMLCICMSFSFIFYSLIIHFFQRNMGNSLQAGKK